MSSVFSSAKSFILKNEKWLNGFYYVLFALIFSYSFYYTTLFRVSPVDQIMNLLGYGATALLVPICICSVIAEEDKKLAIVKLWIVILALFQQLYLPRFKMSALELLMVGASGKSYKTILKIYVAIGLFFMIAAFIGSSTGYLPDFVDGHRHNFGIVYSLDCAAHWLYLLIAAHMLWFKDHPISIFIGTSIIALVVWFLIEAKTSMVLFLVFVLFDLYAIIFKERKLLQFKPVTWFLIGAFIIFCIIIIVMTLNYTPELKEIPFFKKWHTLTWRLQLGHKAFQEYDIRLFGQQVHENLNHSKHDEYFLIDCSYIRCLLMYGLTHFVLLMTSLTLIQRTLIKRGFHIFAFMMMFVAIHSTMEVVLLDVAYNVFILMLFANLDIPELNHSYEES